MLHTSWREVAFALIGAVIGFGVPVLLHIAAAQIGDPEVCGVPIAFFSLPGLFVGAIVGVRLAAKI